MADDGITVRRLGTMIPAGAWAEVAEGVRQELVQRLSDAAVLEWDRAAREGLQRTQADYVRGIQAPEIAEGMATITLVGMLPNRIENGWAAYDMHDTLLGDNVPVAEKGQRGKHRRKDGKGFYRAIPFRHATPGTVGAEADAMGAPYTRQMGAVIGEPLGRAVYQWAKKLRPSTEDGGWGQSFPRKVAPKLRPHHTDSIYAGMYRVQKEYGKATQYTYKTFRTISTGSPGWKVDAKPGKHFAQAVAAHVTNIAQTTLDDVVEDMQR